MLLVSCPPPDCSPTTLKHVVGGGPGQIKVKINGM